ncbi:Uncharacterised protein [Mycobacteroides abscessus subsp. abscessus]|nr:Uncharacterised protein [Mycobacteroides abscessus subsp. abscessus]
MVGKDLGEPQQTARCGRESALDLGQTEFRVVGGDDQVGRECQFAPARQRPALDCRDQWFARGSGGDATEAPTLDAGQLTTRERFEIHTGTEGSTRSGEDADGDVVASFELVHRRGELLCDLLVDGVSRLRAVDGENGYAVGEFGAYRGHRRVPLVVADSIVAESMSWSAGRASVTVQRTGS